MENSINIKCIDFDINHENGDAKCFHEDFTYSLYKVELDNRICDLCPYNEKFKDMNYKEFKEFILNNK
jgi:hypothetical protein